jgi:hypothetical protein
MTITETIWEPVVLDSAGRKEYHTTLSRWESAGNPHPTSGKSVGEAKSITFLLGLTAKRDRNNGAIKEYRGYIYSGERVVIFNR